MQYPFSKIFGLYPGAKTLLDLGCGKGFFSLYAAARGLRVDAIDIDSEIPEALKSIPNVSFQNADLSEWKPEKKWDIIVAHHILQFLDKEYALKKFLPSLIEHLNPGGIFEIFTFTPEETLPVPTKYTPEEILSALPGLEIIEQKSISFNKMHPKAGPHTFYEFWVLAKKKGV